MKTIHQSYRAFRSRWIVACCLFQVLILPAAIPAQSIGTPAVRHFDKSDYRAGTQNWDLLVHPDGLLYVANNKGVLEYDGARWQRLEIPNRTVARSLVLDPQGQVLIGAQDEIGRLDITPDGTLSYTSYLDMLPEELLGFEDVWGAVRDGEATLFSTRRAIFRYTDDSCESILANPDASFENIFKVGADLYIHDIRRGLMKLSADRLISIPGGEQLSDTRIAGIFPYNNKYLIISGTRGYFLLDDRSIIPYTSSSSDFLLQQHAYCATETPEGGFAIGSPTDGLLIVDNKLQPILHLNTDYGLQNNTVLSIARDRDDNYWLGLDNGLDYVQYNTALSSIGPQLGIAGTGYASAVHHGRLYLGTNVGLSYAEWPIQGAFKDDRIFQPIPQIAGQIWHLSTIDSDLYVGAHTGLYRIRGSDLQPIHSTAGSWNFIPLRDRPDRAIEGHYSGINIYGKSDDGSSWTYIRHLDGFGESARIIAQDEDGYIWVTHYYKGVYRLKIRDDDQLAELRKYSADDGLPGDIGINVSRVRGELVFTSPQGMYKYVPGEDRFVPYTTLNALIGGPRLVHRLLEDQAHRLWFSLEDELQLVEVSQDKFLEEPTIERRVFGSIQGKLVDGFENIQSYGSAGVLIGVEKGYLHYLPDQKPARQDMPSPVIRSVREIGQDSTLYASTADRSMPESIELASDHTGLLIQYTSPGVASAGEIEYRSMLAGLESTYGRWSHRPAKEYSRLPPGEYHFNLQSKGSDGAVSPARSIAIVVHPRWYDRGWVRILIGLLAVLFLTGLYRRIIRQAEHEKVALVEENAERIEQKESELIVQKEESKAEIMRLKNENLSSEIEHKNAQLASATMHLVQKGEILLNIKHDLNRIVGNTKDQNKRTIQQLIHRIDDSIRQDDNWEQFEYHFDLVHKNFLKNLRRNHPQLTPKDQRLCAYLRMNLTTKEIAPLLNISVRGVEISRYRLRKKLHLDTSVNLTDFIMRL